MSDIMPTKKDYISRFMKKRLLAVILIVSFILSFAPYRTHAQNTIEQYAQSFIAYLNALLFPKKISINDLEKKPERLQPAVYIKIKEVKEENATKSKKIIKETKKTKTQNTPKASSKTPAKIKVYTFYNYIQDPKLKNELDTLRGKLSILSQELEELKKRKPTVVQVTPSYIPVQNPNISLSQRIDNLDNVNISNSTIEGTTIGLSNPASAKFTDLTVQNSLNVLGLSNLKDLVVDGTLSLISALKDSTGSVGSAGQVLTSTGTSTIWTSISSLSLGSIDQLSDVDTSTNAPTNGQALVWDASISQWMPQTINTSNIYTTDGTLSNNRNVTLGGNNLSFDTNKLFISGSQNRVGIGVNNPSSVLDIKSQTGEHPSFSFRSPYFSGNTMGSGFTPYITTDTIGRISTWSASGFVLNGFTDNSTYPGVALIGYNSGSNVSTPYVSVIARKMNPSGGYTSPSSNEPVFGVHTGAFTRVFTILGDGRVGVKTSSPIADLDINGTVNIGNNLTGFSGFYDFVVNGPGGGIVLNRNNTNPAAEAFVLVMNNGNSNTGGQIRALSSGGFRFTSSNSLNEFMRVTPSGVGIGTTVPTERLHVNGNFRLTGAFKDGANSSGTSGQLLSSTGSGTAWVSPSSIALGSINQHSDVDTSTTVPTIGQALKWNGTNWVPSNDNTIYNTDGSLTGNRNVDLNGNNLVINGVGNVGIGLPSPSTKLEVSNDSSNIPPLRLRNTHPTLGYPGFSMFGASGNALAFIGFDKAGNNIRINAHNPGAFIRFLTQATERMRLTSSGNLGIGITTPTERLHVNGNLRLTGAFKDSTNSAGIAGQLLTSTGTSTAWQDPNAALSEVLEIDDLTDAQKDIINNNLFLGHNGYSGTFYNQRNTGVGIGVLPNPNTSNGTFEGKDNTALGFNAFNSITTGYQNTAIGSYSGFSLNTGITNTTIGYQSLYSATTGSGNVVVGRSAARLGNPTWSVAVGESAFEWGNGFGNTAVGRSALSSLTTGGSRNVAIGMNAGREYGTSTTSFLTQANNSIFIGVDARALLDNSTNEIVIGYNTTGNGSNSVTLGNDSITKTILKGNIGIGTNNPQQKIDIQASSTPGIRLKDKDLSFSSYLTLGGAGNPNLQTNWDPAANTQEDTSLPSWFLRMRSTAGDDFAVLRAAPGGTPSELLYVASSGNVGIGNVVPTDKLHVSGSLRVEGAIKDFNNSAGTSGQLLSSTGSGTAWVSPSSIALGSINQHSDVDTSTTAPLVNQVLSWNGSAWVPAYDSIYTTDGTLTGNRTVNLNGNNLHFDGTGNIGIGTTAPTNKLQVVGNVRATRFVAADGTAGTPSFRFDLDPNTGIFRPANDSFAITTGGVQRAVIDSSGNFGLGTATPQAKMHIEGGELWLFNNANNPRFIIGDNTTTGEYGWMQWDSTNNYFRIDTSDSPALGLKVKGNNVAIGNIFPSQPLIVANGSTELFKVQSNGNVGINATIPTDTLHVAGSVRIEGALKDNLNSAGTAGQVLTSTGTGFEWKNPVSCVIGGAKVQGNGTVTNSYGIISSVTRTNTGRYTVNFSQALNTSDYYVHLSKEESRITRDDVNIDVSAYNTTNVRVIIHEGDNGTNANIYRDRAFSITIFDANCTALSPLASSDRRLKTNIKNINPQDALNKVLRLQGVRYNWNTEKYPHRLGFDDKPEIGLIAQDVQEVVPEVVDKAPDGYLTLDYGKLAGLFVEAIKDVWQNITSNKREIEELRQENRELKHELCQFSSSFSWCANSSNVSNSVSAGANSGVGSGSSINQNSSNSESNNNGSPSAEDNSEQNTGNSETYSSSNENQESDNTAEDQNNTDNQGQNNNDDSGNDGIENQEEQNNDEGQNNPDASGQNQSENTGGDEQNSGVAEDGVDNSSPNNNEQTSQSSNPQEDQNSNNDNPSSNEQADAPVSNHNSTDNATNNAASSNSQQNRQDSNTSQQDAGGQQDNVDTAQNQDTDQNQDTNSNDSNSEESN